MVLVAEGVGTDPVLLVMMCSAKADAKDVVWPLTSAGIRGRAQMRKVDRASVASWDAAAMRFDPAPVSRPHLLHGYTQPELWALQPVRQPHDRLSPIHAGSELVGRGAIPVGRNRYRKAARPSGPKRDELPLPSRFRS